MMVIVDAAVVKVVVAPLMKKAAKVVEAQQTISQLASWLVAS